MAKGQFPNLNIVSSVRHLSQKDSLLASGFSDVILEKDGKLQTAENFSKILELVGPATMEQFSLMV